MNGIVGAFRAIFFNHQGGTTPAVEPAEPRREAAPKCTVLVIDDDPGILEVLRPLLRTDGFTVLTAQSGAKGLDLLRYASKDIKVVLLDYNMPRLSGVDTLQYLRRLAPTVKVMALTGVASELLPEDYRTKVDRHMPKPFRNAELIRAVNDLAGFTTPQLAA